MEKYRYYEWDEERFEMPEEYILSDNSSLSDALKVFWMAGGSDFFEVANPKYYASNWLDFMGNLYKEIMNGRFRSDGKAFMASLSEVKIRAYAEQGVPEIFITGIERT